jgi:hypothetical protein
MSDEHHDVVIDANDPVSEILQTFRAPTGPGEMSRARRLARAARAAALSLPEIAHAAGGLDATVTGDARCALTAVTVDAAGGGYRVEVRLTACADMPPGLDRAIAQHVRQAADERGLGPHLEEVAIVVEGVHA